MSRLALAALGLLGSCHRDAPASTAPKIDACAFDAFYLWPGVRPPAHKKPQLLYLLDGEIRRGASPGLIRLRSGVPYLPGVPLWLVVRIERLDWSEAAYGSIFADLERWRDAGNHVAGLQVDFDASTRGVGDYARFLAKLRSRLPRGFGLSVTGLMDWSADGDPQTLAALRPVIDEVVIQTYQGRDTIPGYAAYFSRMARFPIPFRVALVQGGQWREPTMLAHQRLFKGYVIFLTRRVGTLARPLRPKSQLSWAQLASDFCESRREARFTRRG